MYMAIRKGKPEICVRPPCLNRRHRDRRAPAKRSIAVATGACLVAACATSEPGWYVEPSLPKEQTALLYAMRPEAFYGFGQSQVRIHKIDGLRVSLENPLSWGIVMVSPGRHHIEGYYFHVLFFRERRALVSFAVDFEKGRSYSIRGRSDDDQVQMWVEDTETKEVAGIGTVALEGD
jgi:hypothetical protein